MAHVRVSVSGGARQRRESFVSKHTSTKGKRKILSQSLFGKGVVQMLEKSLLTLCSKNQRWNQVLDSKIYELGVGWRLR